jgi:hypothetical protein
MNPLRRAARQPSQGGKIIVYDGKRDAVEARINHLAKSQKPRLIGAVYVRHADQQRMTAYAEVN